MMYLVRTLTPVYALCWERVERPGIYCVVLWKSIACWEVGSANVYGYQAIIVDKVDW